MSPCYFLHIAILWKQLRSTCVGLKLKAWVRELPGKRVATYCEEANGETPAQQLTVDARKCDAHQGVK